MIWLSWYDIKRQWRNPSFWVTAALLQFILGWLFLESIETYIAQQAQLNSLGQNPGLTQFLSVHYLAPAAMILMFCSPLITMKLLAEEFRNHSYQLLQTSPMGSFSIACSKFISGWFLCLSLLLPALILPFTMQLFLSLDLITFALATLGLMLFLASCVALCLMVSSLTQQPAFAAFSSFSCFLLLWVIGNRPLAINQISPLQHIGPLLSGQVNLLDLAYFILFVMFFMALLVRSLDNKRYLGH